MTMSAPRTTRRVEKAADTCSTVAPDDGADGGWPRVGAVTTLGMHPLHDSNHSARAKKNAAGTKPAANGCS